MNNAFEYNMYIVLPFYRKCMKWKTSESNIIIIQSLISYKNTRCKYKFQEIIYSCIMLTVIRVSCFNVDFFVQATDMICMTVLHQRHLASIQLIKAVHFVLVALCCARKSWEDLAICWYEQACWMKYRHFLLLNRNYSVTNQMLIHET